MPQKPMISKVAETAKGNSAAMAEKDVLAADEAHVTPRALLKHISDVVSTNIGLFEIRMNLLLWRLFKMSKQKEGQSVADSGISEEVIN